MLKSFKEFLKAVPPILVKALPVHGSHAKQAVAPITVRVQPVHGSHARIVESEQTPIEKTSDRHWNALSDKEKKHVNKYTNDSGNVNSNLVAGNKVPKHAEHIKHLDSATHKPIEHDVAVHSGVGFDPNHVAKKHPERHIKMPAYTSTSLDKDTADDFATLHAAKKGSTHLYDSHSLHINMKSHHHGLPILHHGGNEYGTNEHEVLLPRNTVLKVHKKPTVEMRNNGKTKHHTWHADIVSQDE